MRRVIESTFSVPDSLPGIDLTRFFDTVGTHEYIVPRTGWYFLAVRSGGGGGGGGGTGDGGAAGKNGGGGGAGGLRWALAWLTAGQKLTINVGDGGIGGSGTGSQNATGGTGVAGQSSSIDGLVCTGGQPGTGGGNPGQSPGAGGAGGGQGQGGVGTAGTSGAAGGANIVDDAAWRMFFPFLTGLNFNDLYTSYAKGGDAGAGTSMPTSGSGTKGGSGWAIVAAL